MAGPQHALTMGSKGRRSRSQGYGMKCASSVCTHVDMTAQVSS